MITKNNKTKCTIMLLAILIIIVVGTFGVVICSFIGTIEKYIWPDNQLTSLLPIPPSSYGYLEISDEKEILIEIYRVSEKDFEEYTRNCASHSFDLYTVVNEKYFSAYDWKGNVVEINYDKKHRMMVLHAYESDEVSILQGLEYYELNYYAYYSYDANTKGYYADYSDVIEKYTEPCKTTIAELKTDFPFEESGSIVTKKLKSLKIELDDETDVWVYASYQDNCKYHDYKYTYDELSVSENCLDIGTHFDELYSYYPKPDKNGIVPDDAIPDYRIIVVTVIPIDQKSFQSKK